MSKIKAAIFDMDGVLVDAREWHYKALNKALALFGFQISRFDHLNTYDGLPTVRKLEMLTLDHGLPTGLHKVIGELKQHYTLRLIHAHCKPCFAHEYALAKLKAEGYRLALASNSVRATVELMLEKSLLQHYFDFTVCNQDVWRPKPDPEIYSVTIGRLGILPRECLVIEDNAYGIRAAEAAGAHVMVVRSTHDVTYEGIRSRITQLERGIEG